MATSPTSNNQSQTLWIDVTEGKKVDLDALTMEVIDAQDTVNKFQAIVTSLVEKVNNFQIFTDRANTSRATTLNNKNLMNQLVQSALNLRNNSKIAVAKMVEASKQTDQLSVEVKQIIDKLIYSAEVLNKLSNIIIKKKAINPLISDELISLISTAGTDANNAVALTLVALQSTFAANASAMESSDAVNLANKQADNFHTALIKDEGNAASLLHLLNMAYKLAKAKYAYMENALVIATNQLNKATMDLTKAQVRLKSLQAGLAAANAAALA